MVVMASFDSGEYRVENGRSRRTIPLLCRKLPDEPNVAPSNVGACMAAAVGSKSSAERYRRNILRRAFQAWRGSDNFLRIFSYFQDAAEERRFAKPARMIFRGPPRLLGKEITNHDQPGGGVSPT
jgi:hypothetical protein